MDPNAIIVLIIVVAAIIGLALFLVLRKSGGSFSASARHGDKEFSVSAKSDQPQAPPTGQIKMKGTTAKRGSIEAATDRGGKIDLEDATAERDIKTSTTGSDPPRPKA